MRHALEPRKLSGTMPVTRAVLTRRPTLIVHESRLHARLSAQDRSLGARDRIDIGNSSEHRGASPVARITTYDNSATRPKLALRACGREGESGTMAIMEAVNTESRTMSNLHKQAACTPCNLAMACLSFSLATLPGVSGCTPFCFSNPRAGYHVYTELVDGASGDPLAGAAVEITLEGEGGPIGKPGDGDGVTNEDGGYGRFVQTGMSEERFCITLGPQDSLALQGLAPMPQHPGPPDLDPPPAPIRALLTVTVNSSTTTTSVNITDEMVFNCALGGTQCSIRLGTVAVALD